MKNLLLIILPFLIISCDSNNDEKKEKNDFAGYYKITSIKSETAIDLNNDGIKSKNILEEMSGSQYTPSGVFGDFYNPENQDNYAEVRPTKEQTNYTQMMSFNFPVQVIDYEDDLELNKPFLVEYSSAMNLFLYEFVTQNEITISNKNEEWDSQFGEVKNLTRIDKKSFQINLDNRMFDFSSKQWIVLNLNATYKKVQ